MDVSDCLSGTDIGEINGCVTIAAMDRSRWTTPGFKKGSGLEGVPHDILDLADFESN